jgi:hypothetical protein
VATKTTLATIGAGYGSVAAINANFTAIADAIDDLLSRSGEAPNEMLGDLDMNGYAVLNASNLTALDDDDLISGTVLNLFITNNLFVDGDTVLGDGDTGGSTTVNLINSTEQFTIVTEDGDTFVVDGDGNVTLTIAEGDTFTITGDGDTVFQTDVINDGNTTTFINGATIDLPDGTVEIADLSEEVLNLIFSSSGGGGGSSGSVSSGDGRLSLASGVKVMTTDYTAKTTVYYVGGVLLFFNDGSGVFNPFNIGELSNALSDATYSPAATAADSNYDLFGWKDTLTVSGITRSGTTATATTSAAHNITTGAIVYISGADQSAYNGYHTLTGGSGSTFTFEVAGSPTTPATGTITAETGRLSRGPAWRNAGQAITGATNATPIVITAASHGLSTGDSVEVSNVGGNTAANGTWTVTVINGNSFSLQTSVGNAAYTSGGAFAARGVGAATTQIELVGSTYVNSVAITNGPGAQLGTYLGTIHTNGSNQLDWKLGSAAAGGGPAYLSVWNVSNRGDFFPSVLDSTASWTYGASAARPMNNSTNNRISFVRGLNTDPITATIQSQIQPYNGLGAGNLVGLDSITDQAASSTASATAAQGAGITAVAVQNSARFAGLPGLGFHYVQALEFQGSPAIGSGTWYGSTTGYTTSPLYTTAFFAQLTA